MQYLLSPTPDHNHCPFPIEITPDNRWHWHPYDARVKHHIFRNRHEIPERPRPRAKHVINAYDWPERVEEVNIRRELAKKEAGEPFDEVFLTAAIKTTRQITPTSRLWEYHKKEIMELDFERKRQGRRHTSSTLEEWAEDLSLNPRVPFSRPIYYPITPDGSNSISWTPEAFSPEPCTRVSHLRMSLFIYV